MNKKLLLLLGLSWIVAGCTSAPPRNGDMFGENGTVSVSGCAAPMAAMACTGDKNKPEATINLDTLTVTPECINAKKGKRIKFILESTKDFRKGSVTVFPENAPNFFWLARENTNLFTKKKIYVRVPKKYKSGDAFPEGTVKYGIHKDDGNCIDPRIRVQN